MSLQFAHPCTLPSHACTPGMTAHCWLLQAAGADAQTGQQAYEAVLKQLQARTPQLLNGTQLYQRTDATRLMPVGCDRCGLLAPSPSCLGSQVSQAPLCCLVAPKQTHCVGLPARQQKELFLTTSLVVNRKCRAGCTICAEPRQLSWCAAWMPFWEVACVRQQSQRWRERRAPASLR
jgi:hypothetical protein